MRLRLTPRESTFYTYFTQAAENLVTGTDLLVKMLADPGDRTGLAERLSDVEHSSDDITHSVFRLLNTTFVTPFDREDIYRLGATLDDVMDEVESAGSMLTIYGIEDQLPGEIAEIGEILSRCAHVTAEAMPRLQSMKDLDQYWIEANRLENEADQVYRRLLARLFGGEYDALTVLKLKELADGMENAADAFEHVANAVETIAVKES